MGKKTELFYKEPGLWLSILAAVLVVGGVIGYVGYNAYLDSVDKQRFETVRHSMEELHEQLQTAASSGEEWEVETFCSQGSVKFQDSAKSCTVKTSAEMYVTRDTQAKAVIEKYASVFRQNTELFAMTTPYATANRSPGFPDNLAKGASGASYREKETGVVCGSFFEIGDNIEENTTKRILEISFSCNGVARELHYLER